jgi:general stress protein 26
MTRGELVAFLKQHRYAVQASVAAAGAPQAAVVGIAVNDALEIVFDTLDGTRKCVNLRRDPRIALVIGWDDEQTVQYDGVADEPKGAALADAKAVYMAAFPDGREREAWPGITYFRVRPRWIRYSDFRAADPRVVEFTGFPCAGTDGPGA